MHVQLCMRLMKFQIHVHIQVHASRAAAGTWVTYLSGIRVVNYPGIFLLLDGYPVSEYLICRIYLIGFSEVVQ